jgi:hypothetical protein
MYKEIKLHKHKNKLQVEWMIRGIWNDQKLQKANIIMWPKKEAMWGYICLSQIIIGCLARVQRDS